MCQPADFVFDLDGTISDLLIGIHRCMNYALVADGFGEVSESTVARLVGPPLDDAFRELVSNQDGRQIAKLVQRYRERYAQTGYAENTLYEGVASALSARTGVVPWCMYIQTSGFCRNDLAHVWYPRTLRVC